MTNPSISELSRGRFNRYTLVIATAKCARMITDEYVRQREFAEKRIANKETEKSLASMIKKEYRDDKAVKSAINHLYAHDYAIVGYDDDIIAEAEQKKAEKAAEDNIITEE